MREKVGLPNMLALAIADGMSRSTAAKRTPNR